MAVVISKCRYTGNHMFLAVEVNPQLLERSGGPFAVAYCPFCDTPHSWHVEDSRLAKRSGIPTFRVREAGGVST
jgi:hypothetical protein